MDAYVLWIKVFNHGITTKFWRLHSLTVSTIMISITVRSKWEWWRLKSPASRLFTQPFFFRRRSKKNSSASLAFVREIHRWPVNSLHKGPVTRKMFPFNDVIMKYLNRVLTTASEVKIGQKRYLPPMNFKSNMWVNDVEVLILFLARPYM